MTNPVVNAVGESAAAGAVIAVFAKALPPLAALAAVVWYAFQIWESQPGRRWRARWRKIFIDRSPLSIEDKVAFLLAGSFSGAAGFIILAIYRLTGV